MKDQWAAISRQGVRGSHLRIGTKREVTLALGATFESRVQQRDWTRYECIPLEKCFRFAVKPCSRVVSDSLYPRGWQTEDSLYSWDTDQTSCLRFGRKPVSSHAFWNLSVTPRTLGTLNMTEDEDWREAFVPTELLACNAVGGSLPLRLLVRVFAHERARASIL